MSPPFFQPGGIAVFIPFDGQDYFEPAGTDLFFQRFCRLADQLEIFVTVRRGPVSRQPEQAGNEEARR